MRRFLLAVLRSPVALVGWIGCRYRPLLAAMAMLVVTLLAAVVILRPRVSLV